MRKTSFTNAAGEEVEQSMQLADGRPKGIKTVLRERGKWRPNMVLECLYCHLNLTIAERIATFSDSYAAGHHMFTPNCCARKCLSNEKDFLGQREWLREVIEDRGHTVIFYPKYHCELNYIEMIWAYLKNKLKMSCTNNFDAMITMIPNLMENLSTAVCRRSAEHCLRVMDRYRAGMSGPLLDYAVRKYSSHRRISPKQALEISQEFEKTPAGKTSLSQYSNIAEAVESNKTSRKL